MITIQRIKTLSKAHLVHDVKLTMENNILKERSLHGVKPKFIHDEQRMIDLIGGLYRYIMSGKIKEESNLLSLWAKELQDLISNYNK